MAQASDYPKGDSNSMSELTKVVFLMPLLEFLDIG